jgi:hypothetical protein
MSLRDKTYECAYPHDHVECKYLDNGYCRNPGNCPTHDKELIEEEPDYELER